MIVSVMLTVIALVALVFLFRAARHRSLAVSNVEDLPGRLQPVDLEAFRNLVDPEEKEFLRVNLPANLFRTIQRERMRAAIEYVSCAAYNANILLRVGSAASHSLDPRTAEAGRALVDNAMRLRLYAILSLARLRVGVMFPQLELSPAAMADMYQQLSTSLTYLGRVQYPLRGARISATI